jgi:hypothetical protein
MFPKSTEALSSPKAQNSKFARNSITRAP